MAVVMSAATKGPVLIRVKISMFADVMLDGKTVEVEFVSLVFHLLDVSQNILKKYSNSPPRAFVFIER